MKIKSYSDLYNYYLIFIPLAYLVVKFIFYYECEKNNVSKRKILIPLLIGTTVLNIILKMHVIYTIFIIIFLIFTKTNYVIDPLENKRIIAEYKKNKR